MELGLKIFYENWKQRTQKKTLKREADIEFLHKGLLYRLTPKFVRFKLYREAVYRSRRAKIFKNQLISAEITS